MKYASQQQATTLERSAATPIAGSLAITVPVKTHRLHLMPATMTDRRTMYHIKTVEGEAMKKEAAEERPFGPAFPQHAIDKAAKMEVWGTSANDSKEYTMFKLFTSSGCCVGHQTIMGY